MSATSRLTDRMFVAQTTLEAWAERDEVELDGTEIRLGRPARAYRLEPAVRFTNIIDGAQVSNLIGKVLGETQIAEFGGELLGDSVVFGEVAFQVTVGFIATSMDESNQGGVS